jgi:hypothetical protein
LGINLKAISELLGAFMVEPIAVHCKSFPDFYDKLTTNYLNEK